MTFWSATNYRSINGRSPVFSLSHAWRPLVDSPENRREGRRQMLGASRRDSLVARGGAPDEDEKFVLIVRSQVKPVRLCNCRKRIASTKALERVASDLAQEAQEIVGNFLRDLRAHGGVGLRSVAANASFV